MEKTEIESFAEGIMRKNRWDPIRAEQYLEHCIRVCDAKGNIAKRDEFAEVRYFIAERYKQ